MDITAGEYGFDLHDFKRMLDAGAVDVLQADATRCGGITGFLRGAALARAYSIPISTHTAPALHLHVACSEPTVRNLEYFDDHVRIEKKIFDGFVEPRSGRLAPDLSRPGLGIEPRRKDLEKLAA